MVFDELKNQESRGRPSRDIRFYLFNRDMSWLLKPTGGNNLFSTTLHHSESLTFFSFSTHIDKLAMKKYVVLPKILQCQKK